MLAKARFVEGSRKAERGLNQDFDDWWSTPGSFMNSFNKYLYLLNPQLFCALVSQQ